MIIYYIWYRYTYIQRAREKEREREREREKKGRCGCIVWLTSSLFYSLAGCHNIFGEATIKLKYRVLGHQKGGGSRGGGAEWGREEEKRVGKKDVKNSCEYCFSLFNSFKIFLFLFCLYISVIYVQKYDEMCVRDYIIPCLIVCWMVLKRA